MCGGPLDERGKWRSPRVRFNTRIAIGLPITQLIEPLRACIVGTSGPRTVALDATDRRGRRMRCLVTFAPLLTGREVQGAIMLMEDGDRAMESIAAQ